MLRNAVRGLGLLAASLFPTLLSAQPPQVYYRGILNAAHFLPPGLPQGAIARGAVFSIFGVRLGPANSPALAFPLPATLGGVSVKVTQGTVSVAALPVFVSAGQINAIMPSTAPLGTASLTVTFNGREGPPSPVRIVNSSFGIYTALGAGNGPGIFQNFVTQANQPLNAPATAARPGQVITMWGTGLGPVTHADNIAPVVASLTVPTEVFVGGKAAAIAYNGRSPCCAGSDQIVFTVPADAPLGCWVPVEVRTEGKSVSNVVTMAITTDGSPCLDASNPFAAAVRTGGRVGEIRFTRLAGPLPGLDSSLTPSDSTVDTAILDFRLLTASAFGFYPRLSLPPTGTCTLFAGAGPLGTPPPALPDARRLNPGASFTASSGAASRIINTVDSKQTLTAQLGKLLPGTVARATLFLQPGTVSIRNASGSDVAAFQASGVMPAAITWINRSQLTSINRTQPLTVTWSGSAASQLVEIAGGTFDAAANGHVEFSCIAPGATASFTVPSAILQTIPPSGVLTVSTLRVGAAALAPFTAAGLDAGVVTLGAYVESVVTFQ